MRPLRRASAVARTSLAVIVCAVVASCSSDEPPGRAEITPARLEAQLPATVLGLEVVEENVRGDIKGLSRAYLESVGLFSFRENDDLLRATLQIGRFNDVAPNELERFRDSIIGQLGASVPIELRVGDDRVFLAAGGEQSVYTWFDDEGFYALSVRSDYPFPRTMVRRLVGIDILR